MPLATRTHPRAEVVAPACELRPPESGHLRVSHPSHPTLASSHTTRLSPQLPLTRSVSCSGAHSLVSQLRMQSRHAVSTMRAGTQAPTPPWPIVRLAECTLLRIPGRRERSKDAEERPWTGRLGGWEPARRSGDDLPVGARSWASGPWLGCARGGAAGDMWLCHGALWLRAWRTGLTIGGGRAWHAAITDNHVFWCGCSVAAMCYIVCPVDVLRLRVASSRLYPSRFTTCVLKLVTEHCSQS